MINKFVESKLKLLYMKNLIKENNYKEICNYIEMYDKCYDGSLRGFSAYENICQNQRNILKKEDLNHNLLKINEMVKNIKKLLVILESGILD